MDDSTAVERLLLVLFVELQARLLHEYDVGVMLIAKGQDFVLKVRTKRNTGDEAQPYFALTIRERSGALVVNYKPRGHPPAEPE